MLLFMHFTLFIDFLWCFRNLFYFLYILIFFIIQQNDVLFFLHLSFNIIFSLLMILRCHLFLFVEIDLFCQRFFLWSLSFIAALYLFLLMKYFSNIMRLLDNIIIFLFVFYLFCCLFFLDILNNNSKSINFLCLFFLILLLLFQLIFQFSFTIFY